MLEIEAKYPVQDWAALEQKLLSLGAAFQQDRQDEDQYFNAPDRDFAQTDEAVRVRRIGNQNLLTYKGPKRDAVTKTRKEIEIPCAEGEAIAQDLANFLLALGYRSVAIVHKKRRVYHLNRQGYALQICFDEVTNVGTYVELEIVAEESHYEPAREALLKFAEELGLSTSERQSYLSLLLQRQGK